MQTNTKTSEAPQKEHQEIETTSDETTGTEKVLGCKITIKHSSHVQHSAFKNTGKSVLTWIAQASQISSYFGS